MNMKLGRLKSPFDKRDYPLGAYIPRFKLGLISKRHWTFPKASLNQEETYHCVGFSGAGFGICRPVEFPYTDEDGHSLYYLCKEIDGEPGKENGSYVRSIAKVLQNRHRIKNYAFANSMDEIIYWLLQRGPMIAGTIWTDGMYRPNNQNVISVYGDYVGGHAYLLTGYEHPYIDIQNSWGNGWGDKGKARISVSDFETLFNYDGEVMASVEIPLRGFNQRITRRR